MNVNEREQADQRPRANADLSASIIGSAMDAIIAVDDALRIVLFNPAAERIFACPANEAIGSSVERFIPQRFRAGYRTRVRQFDQSGVINRTLGGGGTLCAVRASGEEFPIEASISKVESAGNKFFTAVIRDITERERTEKTLRNSEERFRLAAQAGRMFAYEWNAVTDLITRSPESAQILGINEAVSLTGEQLLAKVHPDDRERLKDTVACLSPEQPNFHLIYRVIRPDATVIWVERSSCAHFDEHGTLLRIVGMVADITERKRVEEALRESEQRFRLVANTAPVMIWMSGPDNSL
jgi:PAS domain S-box-containing protein